MGSQEHRSGAVVLVNCRGPLSMPRAELGIHGLNRWAVNCLEMSRKRGVQAARNAPSEDRKCWQRVELGIHGLKSWNRNWSRKVRETRSSGGLQDPEASRPLRSLPPDNPGLSSRHPSGSRRNVNQALPATGLFDDTDSR